MTSGDQAGLQGTQPSRQAGRKGMIRGGVTRTRQDRAVQQRMWGGSETCDERGWEGSHRHCSSTPPLPNKTWFHGSLPGLCLFPLRWFSSPTTSFPPSADPTALHTCDPHTHGRRPWTLAARRRPWMLAALSRPVCRQPHSSPSAGLPSAIGAQEMNVNTGQKREQN